MIADIVLLIIFVVWNSCESRGKKWMDCLDMLDNQYEKYCYFPKKQIAIWKQQMAWSLKKMFNFCRIHSSNCQNNVNGNGNLTIVHICKRLFL